MSSEIKNLEDVFGVTCVDKNTSNSKTNRTRPLFCSKGKSKTPKLRSTLFPVSRKPYKSSGTTMSAKKFTFKAPASVPPRPHLSVASVPSVQVSQGWQSLKIWISASTIKHNYVKLWSLIKSDTSSSFVALTNIRYKVCKLIACKSDTAGLLKRTSLKNRKVVRLLY